MRDTTAIISGVPVMFTRFKVIQRGARVLAQTVREYEEGTSPPSPTRQIRPSKQQTVEKIVHVKVQYGLGSDGNHKLRQLANAVIAEGNVKVPLSKVTTMISLLDTRYKSTQKEQAYNQAVNDLIEWFKRNTKPKS
jgi:hypothetical protein